MPTVITKKSTVVGKVPLDTDLQVGELAVNTADKILYSKHSDGSVVRLTADPSSQISFFAYPAVDQSVTTGTWVKITFGTVVNNVGTKFATSRFTPGVAGTYQISGSLYGYSNTLPTNGVAVAIYKNGTRYVAGSSGASSTSQVVNISVPIYLTSTDYVELWANVSGSSPVVKAGATNETNFGGFLVSGGATVVGDWSSPGPIGETTPDSIKTTKATVVSGTVTSSVPAVNVTQTWNNAAVPFTAEVTNVTNTASAAASLLRDWQFDGVSKCSIRKDGRIILANGSFSSSDPGLFGAAATTTGLTIDSGSGNPTIRVFRSGSPVISISNTVRITGLAVALNTDTANHVGRFWGPSAGLVELDSGTTGAYRDLKLRNQITTGSISTGLSAKTADYTLTANDGTITADSTSAAITLTLETAVGHNRIHAFKKTAGSNTITIDGNASETIDGATSITLTDRCILQSNGTEWKQIA